MDASDTLQRGRGPFGGTDRGAQTGTRQIHVVQPRDDLRQPVLEVGVSVVPRSGGVLDRSP